MTGAINSSPNFLRQSYVLNGASDLMVEIFGSGAGCPRENGFWSDTAAIQHGGGVSMTVEIE